MQKAKNKRLEKANTRNCLQKKINREKGDIAKKKDFPLTKIRKMLRS